MAETESGRVAVVFTANIGTTLAADATAGDSVITVDDTSDFDVDGTLRLTGQILDYLSVDDDTGLVSLAAPLDDDAATGELVTLWDTGTDQPAVEYRAHVELPGALDNADAVDAEIRHSLIPYLEQGIRGPGGGESVRLERQGSAWVIVDILGRQPDMLLGFGGGAVLTGDSSGTGSTSITSTVSGTGSTLATGAQAVAMGGGYVEASGVGSLAIGGEASSSTVAGGLRSSAVGADSQAYGDYNFAAAGASTNGLAAIGVGPAASPAGDYAVAIGAATAATNAGAVAIGTDHTGGGAQADLEDDFVLGTANHHVAVPGRFNVAPRTPSGTADTQGAVGDLASDDNYLYAKTSTGWKRAALSTF
jgi:hypothetical protein